MSGNALTPFAWFFMLASMISVTVLVGWCYYRILRSDREFGQGREGVAPERAEIG